MKKIDTALEAGQFQEEDWPLRPWVLAGVLSALGLLISFLTQRPEGADYTWEIPAWRMGLTAFCGAGGIAFALSLRRENAKEAAPFAALIGAVIGLLSWHYAGHQEGYASFQFNIAASVLASLIAVPLFQAGFHRRRFALDYKHTHFYTWTDAISGALALAFVGISWGVYVVLSELFALIGVLILKDLMDLFWFGWTFSGLMFGAGLGVLRNQLKVLGMLQRVVMLVAGILAVPLAIALALFIVSALFSGLDVLWKATSSATPLLMAMSAGSFVLIHAIIRDDDDEMSQSRIQQIAAIVLAAGILPLAIFAAISSGIRIDQHGLTPERIWAAIVVSVAVSSGALLYWALLRSALAKNIAEWPSRLRYGNLRFAVVLCGIALVLALPIFDFGAISARSQLSRLESGEVKAEEFDYSALRWDFGDAGREVLAELAKSKNADIAKGAKDASAEFHKPWRSTVDLSDQKKRIANIRFKTDDSKLREVVETEVKNGDGCERICVILLTGRDEKGGYKLARVERYFVSHYTITMPQNEGDPAKVEYSDAAAAAFEAGAVVDALKNEDDPTYEPKVEIRPYTGRQVYVDGKPLGEPFE